MDGNQFDRITKWMSTRRTRRESVRALVGGAFGAAAAVSGAESALAAKPVKADCCPVTAPKLCNLTCTNITDDPSNCGGCGATCQPVANATTTCAGGVCGFTCKSGFMNCGGVCVDVQSNASNCGTCGHACPGGSTCSGGACQPAGPTCNDHIKNGNETDIDCGGGTCPPCPAGQTCIIDVDCAVDLFCINHVCATCPAGQRGCNGSCVNVQNDPGNCGACGAVCGPIPNASVVCVSGTCHVGACNAGFADCNGQYADGCEDHVATDPNNCGVCGNVCGSGKTCVNGSCVTSAPACSIPGDCPITGNECIAATCVSGVCGTTNLGNEHVLSTGQTTGDCKVLVCDGNGGVIAINDDTDVPSDNNFCTADVCTSGVPSHPALTSGTSCAPASCLDSTTAQGGSACDGAGSCVAGPTTTCPAGQHCMGNGICA